MRPRAADALKNRWLPGARRVAAAARSWPQAQPWSTSAITLLLTIGALIVVLQPRPRAIGLGRVLLAADLLQSFPIEGSRPVPELWTRRLGPAAPDLWRHGKGSWWQLWSGHDDAGAALVLPAASVEGKRRPAGALVVDDLVVIAAGPLAAAELSSQLDPRHRQLQGLELRCLKRLEQGQAVYWAGQGLAGIFGSLTPLLQHWQQGCLSLQLSAEELSWEGEASAVPGLKAEAPTALEAREERAALPADSQLLLRGSRLDLLVGSLLGRSLLRDTLQQSYGLDPDLLKAMAASPFALSLRSLPAGPFRLGLTLEINPSGRGQSWRKGLQQLDQGIRAQGLQPLGTANPSLTPGGRQEAQSWTRGDGAVVGGWRWQRVKPGTGSSGTERLVLFLGPPPPASSIAPSPTNDQPTGSGVVLVLAPNQLAAIGAFPASLPPVLPAASRLQMWSGSQGSNGRAGTISPLRGALHLQP